MKKSNLFKSAQGKENKEPEGDSKVIIESGPADPVTERNIIREIKLLKEPLSLSCTLILE